MPAYTCEICRRRDAAELPCPSCGRYACEKCWFGSLCIVCAANLPSHTLFPDESGVAFIKSIRRLARISWTTVGLLAPALALLLALQAWIWPRSLKPAWRSQSRQLARTLLISSLVGLLLWGTIAWFHFARSGKPVKSPAPVHSRTGRG